MIVLDFAGFRASDIGPMAKHQKRVASKRAECKCLQCDEPIHRRGLCSSHYWAFRILMFSTAIDRRHLIEAKLIREGKLGSNNQGKGGGRRRKPTTAKAS